MRIEEAEKKTGGTMEKSVSMEYVNYNWSMKTSQ